MGQPGTPTKRSFSVSWSASTTTNLYMRAKHQDLHHRYLSRHHFCVCATDLDSSVQTRSVMSLHDISAISLVCTNTTVIWSCMKTDHRLAFHSRNAFMPKPRPSAHPVVRGNHWMASRRGGHLCPEWYTPAPFRTRDVGPSPFPSSSYM